MASPPPSLTSSSSSSSSTTTERRGIPGAQFVEDVENLSQSGLEVNSALSFLQERLQQCKLVEMKLLAQRRDLQEFRKTEILVGIIRAETATTTLAITEAAREIYLLLHVSPFFSYFASIGVHQPCKTLNSA